MKRFYVFGFGRAKGQEFIFDACDLMGDDFARAYEKAFAKDGLEGYPIAAYENLDDARREYPAAPVLTAADL